jgi:hypothetical protein
MKRNLKAIIIAVFCIGTCVGFYFYLSDKSSNAESELSNMEQVITTNLDQNYPKTPREVVKFYNQIITCLVNEEYSEEELKEVGDQAKKMLDQELLALNQDVSYYDMLDVAMRSLIDEGKSIAAIHLSTTEEVEYRTVEGRECAYVDSVYVLKKQKSRSRAGQTYILRKDEQGMWKVLGYYRDKEMDMRYAN